MDRRPAASLRLLFAAALLSACATPAERPVDREPETGTGPVSVRVMSFNIEWGGTGVSFDNVIEAIRRSGADVVGIQEAEGNLDRLADALGWHRDLRNYTVSRYPLLEPPGSEGRYVFVELRPGEVMVLSNLHLPSDPYGPDLVRDGAPLEAVLATERDVRMPVLEPWIDALRPLTADGFPVVVTGDFNSPTHTDWSEAMVGQRPFLRYPVPWPVSVAMAEAGFHDTWRTVHPDVAAKPGLTWWAGRPPLPDYAPGENDAQDRIDLIWYTGPVRPNAARLVGEPDFPGVSISVDPWPSDHRAVVADFVIDPAPAPALVTTDSRIYRDGDTVDVTGRLGDMTSLDIVIRDARNGKPLRTDRLTPARQRFNWTPPGPGHYVLASARLQLEREFWVLPVEARPGIEMLGTGPDSPADIGIRWHDGPGNRNDYLALYRADGTGGDEMLAWAYVDARPEGTLALGSLRPASWCLGGPAGCAWPPGEYVIRLMEDDGYDVLAESPVFKIP